MGLRKRFGLYRWPSGASGRSTARLPHFRLPEALTHPVVYEGLNRLRLLLISSLTAAILNGCSAPELCGDRVVWAPGSERIGLEKNDSLFVCGDPAHPAWQDVPPRQSASFLHSYLESKGYLEPKITIDYDANRVTVDAGKRAVVAIILAENAPPEFSVDPLETNLGQPLEKGTLDRIEGDALSLLKTEGYACATLKLEAHPDGRLVIKINAGSQKTFLRPVSMGDYPVSDPILSRFEPFDSDDRYDIKKTSIAASRMQGEVASSVNYTTVCKDDDFLKLQRSAAFGPPRTWEIGVGASTEEYPLAFIRWKSNRLWKSASKFQIELFGSNKRQELSFELKYYLSEAHPRLYLRPVLSITHRNEAQYDTSGPKFSLYQGRSFDLGKWTLAPEVGFSVSRLRYSNSRYTRTEPIVTPEFTLGGHTNDYELYRGDPRRGFDTHLQYTYVPSAQASSIGVHRLLLTGTYLYNFKNYIQPRWILGIRYKFGTLFTTDGTTPDASKTPPDWFFLVGGDQDLRGFSRNSLPSDQSGAGSVATSGFESRWPGLFSFPLDPLLFLDAGYVGSGNSHFSREVVVSPGFGARSATPLGTIRATYARGYQPAKNIYRSQVFVSFGAEF